MEGFREIMTFEEIVYKMTGEYKVHAIKVWEVPYRERKLYLNQFHIYYQIRMISEITSDITELGAIIKITFSKE